MKFSLREVFNICDADNASSSETSSLLEMYGLTRSSEVDDQNINMTIEGIQTAVNQILEGHAPESKETAMSQTKRSVNRDDLVLDRWRKMAGL